MIQKTVAFAQLLKLYRDEAKINQADLVRRLDKAGFPIDKSTYNNYELGKRFPSESAKFIYSLEKCLRLSDKQVGALFRGLSADYLTSVLDEYDSLKSKDK